MDVEKTITQVIEDFFGPHSKTEEVVDYLLREVATVLSDPKVMYLNTKRGTFALLSDADLADIYGEGRLRAALRIAMRPFSDEGPQASNLEAGD